jgi:pimeloyl-ACP methyl ester carboxylesterase
VEKDNALEPGAESATRLVTLVHGTWASKTPWVQDGSCFQSWLSSELQGACFPFFRWSGRNSHTHRIQAGKELQDHLRRVQKQVERIPDAKHVVIAHSHGGNVVLYALQDDELRRRVDGVVCMATPFYSIRERRLPRLLFGAVLLSLVGAAFMLFQPTGILAVQILVCTEMLLFILCLLFFIISYFKGADKSFGFWAFWKTSRKPVALAHSLRFPLIDPERLLVICASGDEASGALVSSHFLNWLLTRIWNPLDCAYGRLARLHHTLMSWLIGAIILAMITAGLVALFAPEGEPEGSGAIEAVKSIVLLFMLVVGFVVMAFGLVACVLLFLLFLSQLPFGFDAMLVGFEMHTTAETSPPGESRVHVVSLPEDGTGEPGGLVHCRLYEDKRVPKLIGDWVRKLQPTSGRSDAAPSA